MTESVSGSPLVSVIVPAYESANYLNQAVQSVCSQTYTNYELIVVDDGSSDDCVAKYDLPANARLIRHESNRGAGAARNTGIKAAKGEYVALMDHDDVWLPHKLETQVALLQSKPNAALAYCRCDVVDQQLTAKIDSRWSEKDPSSDPLRQFLDGCFIRSCSSILIRRSIFDEVGMFDESLTGTDDCEFYMRLAIDHSFVYDPEPLVLYRMHPGQYTRSLAKMGRSRIRMMRSILPLIKRRRPDLVWPARKRLSNCQLLYAHALLYHELTPWPATGALLRSLWAWPANLRAYPKLVWMPFVGVRCLIRRARMSK